MATNYYNRVVEEDLNVGAEMTTRRNPGGGMLTATQISLSSLALGQAAGSATWDPGEVAVGAKVSTTVTVSGAALGDFALASFSLDVQELSLTATVSATNTVEIVLANNTAAAVNLESGTVRALVFHTR